MTPEEKLEAIRQLCKQHMIKKSNGEWTASSMILPTDVMKILDNDKVLEPEPPRDKTLIIGENVFRYDNHEKGWRDVIGLVYTWRELAEDVDEFPIEVLSIDYVVGGK